MRPVYRLSMIEIDAVVRSAVMRLQEPIKIRNDRYEGRKLINMLSAIEDIDHSCDYPLHVSKDAMRDLMTALLCHYDIEPSWLPGGFAQNMDEQLMARCLRYLDDIVFSVLA